LDRSELLGGLWPRPIKEYKVILTTTQMAGMRWVLLAGLPGLVLLAGFGVWTRRRR
jgi:LPXTG-motif cell wall-anchored protein